ncbi:hypothetical protein AB0H42_25395 [Nocardia sp. NPDC050799]|uniref:hypothetical protein n=1 Tax=Nocardia sp. NPDC050799 TaxID=3154842 RepID=UPI0033CEE6A8
MVEMPEILMPDQNAPGYPEEFKFSPLIESYYRGLPRALRGYWDAFGSGSIVDMPLKPATRSVEGTASARIRNYEAVAAQLERRFQDLQEMDRQMADRVRRSLSATRAGRERVEAAIQRINTDAATVPIGKSKGDHILDYAPAGLDRADRAVVDTTRAHRDQARVLDESVRRLIETTPPPESVSALPALFASDSILARAPSAGEDRSSAPANSSGAGKAPAHRDQRDMSAAAHPADSGAAPTTEPVPKVTTDVRRSSAQDPGPTSRNSPPSTVPDTTGQPDHDPMAAVGETTSAGPGTSLGGRPVVPSAPAATGTSTPWSSRTGAAPGSDQSHSAFSGKRTEAGPTGRQHASSVDEGLVVYVFPDGRTQEVSPVVVAVLDMAFGRRPSTNSRPASPGSSNTIPAGDPIAVRHETDSVDTGDLAVWARGSAVVVVFGTGNNRSYEVIVDGHLQPFSALPGQGPGEFGPFTGFRRLPPAGSDTGVAGRPAKDGQRPTRAPGEREQIDVEVPARAQPYRATDTGRSTDAVAAKKRAGDEGTVVNA